MTSNNRLKIRTHPPLAPFQAWVSFNPEQSIQSLKQSILNLLQPSPQSIPISYSDIILELDVFAINDQSIPWSIDPHLINAQPMDPGPSNSLNQSSKKRSRSPSETRLETSASCPKLFIDSSPNRYKSQSSQLVNNTLPPPEMKSQLVDLGIFNLNPTLNPNVPPLKQAVCKAPVPHGQGKASTKAKNRRRKMKKMRDRERNQVEAGEIIKVNSNQGSNRLFSSCDDDSFLISNKQLSNSPEALEHAINQEHLNSSDLNNTEDRSADLNKIMDQSSSNPMNESCSLKPSSNALTKLESASITSSSFLNALSAYIC